MDILKSTKLYWTKLNNLSNLKKLGLVLAGYGTALAVPYALYAFLDRVRTSPDASGGMQAFGDMVGFLGLFGIIALVPTALALYFLRPFQKFWTIFSIASLSLAAMGVVAASLMGRTHLAPWLMFIEGFIGLLMVLGSPLLGFSFLAFAWIAPKGKSRWRLVAAAGIEFAVIGYAILCFAVIGHWPHKSGD
jgi:hypothetical protein